METLYEQEKPREVRRGKPLATIPLQSRQTHSQPAPLRRPASRSAFKASVIFLGAVVLVTGVVAFALIQSRGGRLKPRSSPVDVRGMQ